ncbi:reverse transcriptase domain-containing protein [Tanacetum coccineum]
MCDASDFAVGSVLGQCEGKHFCPIYFASKTLNNAQQNYTVTEKELLVVVFAFDQFRSYLVISKTVVFTDYYVLKYLFAKQDAKPRLIRWIFLLQEFDIEIKIKKGAENVAADHLSRLENPNLEELRDEDIDDNFLGETLMNVSSNDEGGAPYLVGKILKKFKYILVAIDYVSKWEKAEDLPTNDARVVINSLKRLFSRFGIPKALISDRGTHFYNKQMEKVLKRYGVHHRFATAYHPQTNEQVENTNKALKRILERTVKDNPSVWSRKLDDARWAFRTAYKTPIGTTPYRLLYGKTFHLPLEIEHHAYWALRSCNPDLKIAG